MSVQLAAQLAKEDLSHPEKWVQLLKNYFLRKFKLFFFFTVSYRVILLREANLKTVSMPFSPIPELSNNRKYRGKNAKTFPQCFSSFESYFSATKILTE